VRGDGELFLTTDGHRYSYGRTGKPIRM
jgi:hypothetical protein